MKRFTVHATRRVTDDAPFSAAITFETLESPRFTRPAPRPLRDDERLYINGAFSLAELERIIAWARGPR